MTEFRKPLRFLAEYLTRRGVIVVISDLYDEPDNIIAGLKALRAKGNDIIVFHIMDNFELTFPFEDMAQFEDMETKKKLHIIPEYLRSQYLSILKEHMERIRKELSGARIDYCLMDTSKPLDAGLFSYLAAVQPRATGGGLRRRAFLRDLFFAVLFPPVTPCRHRFQPLLAVGAASRAQVA